MAPRPKRPATDSFEESSSSHGPKKTRFVEPDDDPAKFEEQVDSNLETSTRKGRVKTEGYDSDSSDDGEGVVFSRKAGGGDGAGGEDEDDMFAMGEKEEKIEGEGSTKKRKKEFMRLGDIEGQEFGNDAGDDDSEEEEDEPVDEDEAEKKKKAGMGFEVSSFNMREEMEEGKFAADGTYVRTFDPHAIHDRWMDGLDEREIKKARKRHRQQERIQKERIMAEEKEMEELGGKEHVEQKLVGMLKKGETVLEALQRLGAIAKKNAAKKKKLSKKDDIDSNAMSVEPSAARSDIDEITHLASLLMSLGDTDIYNKTYEELVRDVRRSGKVDPSWDPPSADVKYEYKWDVPGAQDGQVFGPYSEEEMHAWYKAAYFGEGGEKVQVRPVAGEWGNWDDVVT